MKNEKEEVAMMLSAMMASHSTDNFGDNVVETAKNFKFLTGKDIGIKDLEDTNHRIKNSNLPWYKRLFK